MHDTMVEYIRKCKSGVASKELAEKFLKIKNAPDMMAQAAIYGILSTDIRCYQNSSKLWFVDESKCNESDLAIDKLPLNAVYTLYNGISPDAQLLYLALWEVFPEPVFRCGVWLADPAVVCTENQFSSPGLEQKWDQTSSDDNSIKCRELLSNAVPVVLSSGCLAGSNSIIVPKADAQEMPVLLEDLMLAYPFTLQEQLSFESLSMCIFPDRPYPLNTYHKGERFAECVNELVIMLKNRGILSRNDIEDAINKKSGDLLKNKSFSIADLLCQPENIGVYGLKDHDGTYVYIARSKNLRKSLLEHFRILNGLNDDKVEIAKKTDAFDAYQCGSELECCIYEYRLRKKYLPSLNVIHNLSVRDMPDRRIILLPHSNRNKVMTLWVRQGRKIIMKSFTVEETADSKVSKDLDEFFLAEQLAADDQDKDEFAIVSRWIQQSGTNGQQIIVGTQMTSPVLFQTFRNRVREFTVGNSEN